MESSMDWLTLSLMPENSLIDSEENLGRAIGLLRDKLLLDELFTMLEYRGKCKYYEVRLSYNDVTVKLASPEKFNEQGLCIEFSANGLRYFNEYLATRGFTLKQWCGMWRRLCCDGWITKCTRFDEAMDDIRYDGERPLLTITRVCNAICDDEISCKQRTFSDGNGNDDLISFKRNYRRKGGKGLWGTTIYLGQRQSDTYIRFYDKKIEREQAGEKLPENLTSWCRCEFEFHGSNAMSVFNQWLDLSNENFGKRICEVAFENVRFIDRTCTNVSRCPVKRWWREFLNGATKGFKLPKIAPVRTALSRAKRGLNQYASIIATLRMLWGAEGFEDYIERVCEDKEQHGKCAIKWEIVNNYKENKRAYEQMTAFKRYDYTTDISSAQLRSNIYRDGWEYNNQMIAMERSKEDRRQYLLGDVYGM